VLVPTEGLSRWNMSAPRRSVTRLVAGLSLLNDMSAIDADRIDGHIDRQPDESGRRGCRGCRYRVLGTPWA
jgi:hypothetical protein